MYLLFAHFLVHLIVGELFIHFVCSFVLVAKIIRIVSNPRFRRRRRRHRHRRSRRARIKTTLYGYLIVCDCV